MEESDAVGMGGNARQVQAEGVADKWGLKDLSRQTIGENRAIQEHQPIRNARRGGQVMRHEQNGKVHFETQFRHDLVEQ